MLAVTCGSSRNRENGSAGPGAWTLVMSVVVSLMVEQGMVDGKAAWDLAVSASVASPTSMQPSYIIPREQTEFPGITRGMMHTVAHTDTQTCLAEIFSAVRAGFRKASPGLELVLQTD